MPSDTQNTLYQAKSISPLSIPPGATVKVQIIDTTSRIHAPVGRFMTPAIKGHESLNAPAFSFLVEHPKLNRKIVFDLGLRKDWQNLPPVIVNQLTPPDWVCAVEKNVAEILQENGINVAGGEIEAVIWSHWHFDHTGDVTTFPSSTTLIAGAGVKESLLPGYPTNPESPLSESDFVGREYKEIDFLKERTVKLGNFQGIDFFKDGSFFLVDSPGHAIGHMCGLARVTSTQEGDAEDTFVFMGADTAHHSAAIRPNAYFPLPKAIDPSPLAKRYPSACPGHIFEKFHPKKKGNEPYYELNDQTPHDKKQAVHSLELMRQYDAMENVFVVIAHDDTLLDPEVGIEWFPHGSLRTWKEKGYVNRLRWAFLKDFEGALDSGSEEK
ncbi:hypothetical protein B0A52_02472 [Exophiala mesophila]|uniref:Metallo-beta-lactamase domain-containing protein n=1 Tax=Exophiala mesophila TaxID=212818 RepID=A0A438NCS5_EXOME|nr:hypothetical protein B0A52_02472 [Exophiala mesophila]